MGSLRDAPLSICSVTENSFIQKIVSFTIYISLITAPDEEVLLLALPVRRLHCCRQRRFCLHQMMNVCERQMTLVVCVLYTLKANNEKLLNYFTVSKNAFNRLFNWPELHIQKKNTNMRQSIPAEVGAAITSMWVVILIHTHTHLSLIHI